MMRIFIATLAPVFAASISAQAGEASAEAKAGVMKALTAIGCTAGEIEDEDGGYEADDVKCEDGQYDITLDRDFKIVNKEKEDD
jgi:hypothetical protein